MAKSVSIFWYNIAQLISFAFIFNSVPFLFSQVFAVKAEKSYSVTGKADSAAERSNIVLIKPACSCCLNIIAIVN